MHKKRITELKREASLLRQHWELPALLAVMVAGTILVQV